MTAPVAAERRRMHMYRENYDKTIERMHSAMELAKDYSNMKRCEENLQHYNRERAWMCLQDMLREYAVQIDTFGFWVDGVRLIKGVTLESLSDQVVQTQLRYIGLHIPAYVLLKEGKKELAKRMCDWLDSRTNN
ncbi:MAG: hypothetical protein J6J61_03250 [Muribaculaceae bacterium]|nr:hypothetical protein [Muribaculaceae bacterium]